MNACRSCQKGLKALCPLGGVWGHAPQKIFEIGKLTNPTFSDLRQNINTQVFIIFVRNKYLIAWYIRHSYNCNESV